MVNTMVAVETVENDVVDVDLSIATEKKNRNEMGGKKQGREYFHSDCPRTNQRNFMPNFV